MNRIYQIPSIIQAGGVDGMQSLDQDLQRLVTKGSIERKMAQSIADNPKLFAQNVCRLKNQLSVTSKGVGFIESLTQQ